MENKEKEWEDDLQFLDVEGLWDGKLVDFRSLGIDCVGYFDFRLSRIDCAAYFLKTTKDKNEE